MKKEEELKRNVVALYFFIPLFGGIHGLGFSSALRAMLGDSGSTAVPLFLFNTGIECAQVVVAALVVLFYLFLSRVFQLRFKHYQLIIACFSVLLSVLFVWQRWQEL
jgi:hypothetical protein